MLARRLKEDWKLGLTYISSGSHNNANVPCIRVSMNLSAGRSEDFHGYRRKDLKRAEVPLLFNTRVDHPEWVQPDCIGSQSGRQYVEEFKKLVHHARMTVHGIEVSYSETPMCSGSLHTDATPSSLSVIELEHAYREWWRPAKIERPAITSGFMELYSHRQHALADTLLTRLHQACRSPPESAHLICELSQSFRPADVSASDRNALFDSGYRRDLLRCAVFL
ncbi:hypothetical protein CPB85DRAFT_129478 [Mucidula mucida]|nr:hypothetical protein CPB85DRAFT_129478 [Mucidula mucida]